MVKLHVDEKLKKRFKNINFESLSFVFTILYDACKTSKRKRDITVFIYRQNGEYSEYDWHDYRIWMADILVDEKLFLKHLIHEFRHLMQCKALKLKDSKEMYDDTTYTTYINSPIELDARRYENTVGIKAIRLYYRIESMKKSFKELSYYKPKLK